MKQTGFRLVIFISLLLCLSAGSSRSQNSQKSSSPPAATAGAAKATGKFVPSEYALGPGDEISISALEAEEISERPILIGASGNIDIPLVGRLHAAGLTVEQLQGEVAERLARYVKEPQVTVNVIDMRSQPVSIIGEVTSPGVHQLQGRKTLVEMLSLAGGVKAEAGYTVKVTRQLEWGSIPLPNALVDPTGQFSIAEVVLSDVMTVKNPEQNITIMPHDIISVPRADMVYVIGDVLKGGSVILGAQKEVSVLQALSLAGGLGKTAKPAQAKILRPAAGFSKRVEVPIDLKSVLAGKQDDVSMSPGDILFVPSAATRSATMQTLQSALGIGLGSIIYRIP